MGFSECVGFFLCRRRKHAGQTSGSVLAYYGKPKSTGKGARSSTASRRSSNNLKNSKPYKSPAWLSSNKV